MLLHAAIPPQFVILFGAMIASARILLIALTILAFATQGLDAKEKGKFTREELAPLAKLERIPFI